MSMYLQGKFMPKPMDFHSEITGSIDKRSTADVFSSDFSKTHQLVSPTVFPYIFIDKLIKYRQPKWTARRTEKWWMLPSSNSGEEQHEVHPEPSHSWWSGWWDRRHPQKVCRDTKPGGAIDTPKGCCHSDRPQQDEKWAKERLKVSSTKGNAESCILGGITSWKAAWQRRTW